ncbi:sensor histidine kinase [Paenibacillus yanchengensis]|uniref:Sensor histidine kinase n=1 Tax=Paenibacillus yanchengensis TaxID=2035833 RepID=A0ABW4YQH8_9BACL
MRWKNVMFTKSFNWVWFLIVIALIPIFVIGSIAYQTSSEIIRNQTETYSSSILQQVMDNIDGLFRDVENIATLIYTHPDVQNIRELDEQLPKLNGKEETRIRNLIENTIGLYPYIDDIVLYDAYHNVYSRYPVQDLYLTDYYAKSNEYRTFMQQEENTYWFGLHKKFSGTSGDNELKPYVFSYIRNISDLESSRTTLATLQIFISKSAIDQISDKVVWPDKGTMAVMDAEGIVVYDSQNPNLVNTTWEFPVLIESLENKNKGQITEKINGVEQMIHMVKSEETGWVTINMMPLQAINRYSQGIKNVLLMASSVSIVIVMISFYAIISRISQLLAELRKITVKLSLEGASTKELVWNHIQFKATNHIGFKEMISIVKQLMEKLDMAEQKKKTAEFAALQANIHPHFLYNTLETIRMMAVINRDIVVAENVEMLANLFRYIVNSKDEFVTLAEEIQHAKNYMKIQQLRFGTRLSVHFDISKPAEAGRMVRLSLQPLIENAVNHGFEHVVGDKVIRIKAYTHANKITVCVMDNGQGIPLNRLLELRATLKQTQSQSKTDHIGMSNVHQRLRLYFGDDCGLRIYSVQNKGTIVKMTIPYVIQEQQNKLNKEPKAPTL